MNVTVFGAIGNRTTGGRTCGARDDGYCALKSMRWISSPVLLSGLAAVMEPAGAPSGLIFAWPTSARGSWKSSSPTPCLLFTGLLNLVVIACGARPHARFTPVPRSCRYTSARGESMIRSGGHLCAAQILKHRSERPVFRDRRPTGSRNPPACTPLYDSGEKASRPPPTPVSDDPNPRFFTHPSSRFDRHVGLLTRLSADARHSARQSDRACDACSTPSHHKDMDTSRAARHDIGNVIALLSNVFHVLRRHCATNP